MMQRAVNLLAHLELAAEVVFILAIPFCLIFDLSLLIIPAALWFAVMAASIHAIAAKLGRE